LDERDEPLGGLALGDHHRQAYEVRLVGRDQALDGLTDAVLHEDEVSDIVFTIAWRHGMRTLALAALSMPEGATGQSCCVNRVMRRAWPMAGLVRLSCDPEASV
jgi:hypothetical protein